MSEDDIKTYFIGHRHTPIPQKGNHCILNGN